MNDTLDDWFGPECATFGDRLAGAREHAGMTQKQMAVRLGVKLSTIKSWENDMAEPRANRLSMMAGLANVSMMWLINGTGEGLEGPAIGDEPAHGINDLLIEIRAIRSEMMRSAERLARLEKKLRTNLPDGTA